VSAVNEKGDELQCQDGAHSQPEDAHAVRIDGRPQAAWVESFSVDPRQESGFNTAVRVGAFFRAER
jgi:hypothetical protein